MTSLKKWKEKPTDSIQVMLSRYRANNCHECKGTRLRGDASYVKINGKSIQDLVLLPVSETLASLRT